MDLLFINQNELSGTALGFLELTTDEQLAKKIYQATGDKTFKGFLPTIWNTAQIVKMRGALESLKRTRNVTVLNMRLKVPEVSAAAHEYFINNVEKVKGLIPSPGDVLKPIKPVLFVAGLAAAAFLLSQVKGFIPKGKTA